MPKRYSKKAKLAISGVKMGAVFAKIGANKKERASIKAKAKRLITSIKKADATKRKKR